MRRDSRRPSKRRWKKCRRGRRGEARRSSLGSRGGGEWPGGWQGRRRRTPTLTEVGGSLRLGVGTTVGTTVGSSRKNSVVGTDEVGRRWLLLGSVLQLQVCAWGVVVVDVLRRRVLQLVVPRAPEALVC